MEAWKTNTATPRKFHSKGNIAQLFRETMGDSVTRPKGLDVKINTNFLVQKRG